MYLGDSAGMIKMLDFTEVLAQSGHKKNLTPYY